MGTHDDEKSVGISMGMAPGHTNFLVDVIVSTPFVLCAINSVIGGVIVTLLARQLGLATVPAVGLAIVGVLLVFGLQAVIAARGIAAYVAGYEPRFPSPEAPAPAAE